MPSASPTSQCGRRSQVAAGRVRPARRERLVARQLLAPGPDRDVGLLAADRDVRVGRVRDAEEQVLELAPRPSASSASIAAIRSPARGRARRAAPRPRARPGRRRRGSPRRSAFEAALRSALRRSPSPWSARRRGVDASRAAIDERRVLALVDRALADRVRLLAQPLQRRRSCRHLRGVASQPAAASRSRRDRRRPRSRLASSQPARGPFGRPRKAR